MINHTHYQVYYEIDLKLEPVISVIDTTPN